MPDNLLPTWVRLLACTFVLVAAAAVCSRAQGTLGREYWGGFMYNISDAGAMPEVSVYIYSKVNTTGTISIPRNGWSQNFGVAANTGVWIPLPANLLISFGSEGVEGKGFRIVAFDTIEVYTMNYIAQTMDASMLLPIDALGTEYRALTYEGAPSLLPPLPSQMQIVAVEDGTTIEITPSNQTVGGRPAGLPFTVNMGAGQVFQVQSESDLAGSRVRSTNGKKFALFCGSARPQIPAGTPFRDLVCEQVYPVDRWGTYFIAPPFRTRAGDTYRVVTATNNTVVSVDGMIPFTLNDGEFREIVIDSASVIQSDQPIMVAQFSNSSNFDFVTAADPSMLILSPVDFVRHEANFYAFPVAGLEKQYVNIVSLTSGIDRVFLDGASIASSFRPVPGDPFYSYAQLVVSSGAHQVSSYYGVNVYPYAFGFQAAYSYTAGADNLKPCRSPSITVTGDTVFCVGDSVMLDAGPDFVGYTWSNGATTRVLVVRDSGTYSVTTLDSSGCLRPSRPIRVTVHPLPQPSIAAAPDTALCPCDSALLSAPPGMSYQWSTGDTSQTIVARTAGRYDVAVRDPNGCGGAATISITVDDVLPIVALENRSAEAGGAVDVPIVVRNTGNLSGCGLRDYTTVVRFNRTLLRLVAVDGATVTANTTDADERVLTLAGARSGDTLAVLRFVAALGNVAETRIAFDMFRWERCTAVSTDTVGAVFTLLGICYEGGPRLIDVGPVAALRAVRPNPASETTTVEFDVAEDGRTQLAVTDLAGRPAATVLAAHLAPGRYSVTLDAGALRSGQYLVVLTTPTQRFTHPLRVVR